MNASGLDLHTLKEKIRRDHGFNGHLYKDKCVLRRIEMRMRACGVDDLAAYAELLDRDPAEYARLIDNLTVNVTRFFRDASTWEAIRREVVPELLTRARRGPVGIWSAGCATGEEPYTLSILLREAAEATNSPDLLERCRITGTDIHEPSLAAARAAEYREYSLDETPERVRSRWFTPTAPYRLHDPVRNGVSFELLDIVTGEPLPGQSLVLCRNVAIYFSRSVQEEVFLALYQALAPGGYLVLGRSETIVGPARHFLAPVVPRERVYRKETG